MSHMEVTNTNKKKGMGQMMSSDSIDAFGFSDSLGI